MELLNKQDLDKLVGEPFEKFLSRLDLKCPESIDAIPIKWIEKWDADKNKDFYDYCKLLVDNFDENDVKRIIYKDKPPYNTVQALLEDWENENGSNR